MTRSHAQSNFDGVLSTAAALTSAVQAMPSRPYYGVLPRPAEGRNGRRWLTRAREVVLTWHARGRQRRQLMELNDHGLRDIGITRADALSETLKPFWRA
jgi:uncharacterized protein YjiS (DUF1127 family)